MRDYSENNDFRSERNGNALVSIMILMKRRTLDDEPAIRLVPNRRDTGG